MATQDASNAQPELTDVEVHALRRAQWTAISEHQVELCDILNKLEHHPNGILRSLGPDRDVHDAVPLSPHLIKALLDRMPFVPQNEIDYRGVDGRNTPKEQWFHPDRSLLPRPLALTDEERKVQESKADETRKLLEEMKKKPPPCAPQVMSDHDLGLKGISSA
ncbi:hypothetical protein NW762_005690 [Fusarium torreyae]|uniref:Uncharacterized protein n=1 Tax=Fusarium torreyae TaxID=1237075 RepID=A0A9W8S394_9HYPO|nr:hypothetical protein NW762_005690 [Fusarium torreyae]